MQNMWKGILYNFIWLTIFPLFHLFTSMCGVHVDLSMQACLCVQCGGESKSQVFSSITVLLPCDRSLSDPEAHCFG